MIESGAPAIVFITTYSLSKQDLQNSLYAAISVAAIFAVLRLMRRETQSQVIAGFIGVAFSAWLATKSGKAENFFLPGILTNLVYATVCIISLIINKPILGYVLESLRGQSSTWQKNKEALKRYRAITILWSLVFLLRVLIMGPLYLANETTLLGFFKVALGWPLFGLAAYLTFVLNKRAVKA
jgi:intracellular septation protein A